MSNPELTAHVRALRRSAGVALRPEVRTLVLSGPDRVRFLNGMVTTDVAAIQPGKGAFGIKTNNRGRVEGCLRIRAAPPAVVSPEMLALTTL